MSLLICTSRACLYMCNVRVCVCVYVCLYWHVHYGDTVEEVTTAMLCVCVDVVFGNTYMWGGADPLRAVYIHMLYI